MKVSMIKYLKNILLEFPEHLGITVSPPATEHLFKMIPNNEAK